MKKIISLILVLFCFISCDEIVNEKDISSQVVNILAPTNNAQFNSTSVTFSWDKLADATEYRIQIAKPNFSNATEIILDTKITESNLTQQLNVGTYEWRIKALNGSSETQYVTRSFTVVSNTNFADNIVVLQTPINNYKTNSPSQNLSWSSIIGATSYQVQVFDNSNTLILDTNTTNSNYNYSFPEGSFTWKVRASNGSAQTLYTSRSILTDYTNPNVAVLNTPTNGATVGSGSIVFNWTRIPITGSAEFDTIFVYSDSGLSTLVLQENASSQSITLSSITNPGTYYWRVKSFDEAGNSSSFSTVKTFIKN
jgi:hypothetical protein